MKIKFSRIANFVAGQSPESKYYSNNSSDGEPFLQGNRTFGIFYPSFDTYTSKVTKIAKQGDILMSVRAPVGDLNFAPCDLCIGRGLAAITAKNKNNDFLFYALKYNIQNLIRKGAGTTFDSVTKDIVNDMDMIIPDDELEQKHISILLKAIDRKIENNIRINSELESMAKTLYDYWFLQFEFPNEEGKPYKSSGGKMVWNEELKREIPEGWEVRSLGDIIVEKEKSNIQTNQVNNEGTIPFYTSGESVLFTNEYLVDGFNCYLSTGGNAHLEIYDGKASYSTDTWCITSKVDLQYVLAMYFKTIIDYMDTKFFAGTGLKHLQKPLLKKEAIVVPNNDILNKFNKVVGNYFKEISKNKTQNQKLASLRDWLLPMLMNGQVTIELNKN